MIHSRDVIFDETGLGFEKEQQIDLTQSDSQPAVEIDVNTEETDDQDDTNEMECREKGKQIIKEDKTSPDQSDGESSTVPHRSEHTQQRPDYYGVQTHMTKEQVKEPVTVNQS